MNKYLQCGPAQLGAIPVFDADCPHVAGPRRSQLVGVIILPVSAPGFDDWTSKYDVTSGVNNANAENNTGKFLLGKGGIESEETTAILGRVNKVTIAHRFTLTLETLIGCVEQIDFLRRLQGNWLGVRIWGYTAAGTLIGGADGIKPNWVNARLPIGAERSDVEVGQLTVEYIADADPPRAFVPGLFTLAAGLEPAPETFTNVVAQTFISQPTASLIWTANGGALETPYNAKVWVFANGQKLLPSGQYTITPNSGPGQSTITIDSSIHISGNDYQVFLFPTA